jgi:hypothetical protein
MLLMATAAFVHEFVIWTSVLVRLGCQVSFDRLVVISFDRLVVTAFMRSRLGAHPMNRVTTNDQARHWKTDEALDGPWLLHRVNFNTERKAVLE